MLHSSQDVDRHRQCSSDEFTTFWHVARVAKAMRNPEAFVKAVRAQPRLRILSVAQAPHVLPVCTASLVRSLPSLDALDQLGILHPPAA